jgi:dGTPase
VFVNHEGDLYRTRLTHSLEVTQIARTIARALYLNETLVEAIALSHDLGHTPFGHAGQDSLNDCMNEYGGFEHNLQSLRVVDELEVKYAEFSGLNLSFETREGILKHCSIKNARELGDVGERFLKGEQFSLEAQVANIADAIAYNNHDVDDGLRSGFISIDQLREQQLFQKYYEETLKQYSKIENRQLRYETIRRMINAQVNDLINTTNNRLKELNLDSIDAVRKHSSPIVGFSDVMLEQHIELKSFLMKNLYRHEKVLEMTSQAKAVIELLFQQYMEQPKKMPEEFYQKALMYKYKNKARIVADYISGMTDRFAIREHKRLA